MSNAILEHVRDLSRTLAPEDKAKLIGELAQQLLKEPSVKPASSTPYPSLRGSLSHLGPAPTAEEIDEARREAWAKFPREDI